MLSQSTTAEDASMQSNSQSGPEHREVHYVNVQAQSPFKSSPPLGLWLWKLLASDSVPIIFGNVYEKYGELPDVPARSFMTAKLELEKRIDKVMEFVQEHGGLNKVYIGSSTIFHLENVLSEPQQDTDNNFEPIVPRRNNWPPNPVSRFQDSESCRGLKLMVMLLRVSDDKVKTWREDATQTRQFVSGLRDPQVGNEVEQKGAHAARWLEATG